MAKKKDLGAMVDEKLIEMFENTEEPSDGRLKLLNTAIKKLALDAKLTENEYGDFFGNDDPAAGDTGGVQDAGKKHRPRKRTNGAGDEPAIEP